MAGLTQGTRWPVDDRLTTRTTAALRSWLLTSGPTPYCLCKPFSCKTCPGTMSAAQPHKKITFLRIPVNALLSCLGEFWGHLNTICENGQCLGTALSPRTWAAVSCGNWASGRPPQVVISPRILVTRGVSGRYCLPQQTSNLRLADPLKLWRLSLVPAYRAAFAELIRCCGFRFLWPSADLGKFKSCLAFPTTAKIDQHHILHLRKVYYTSDFEVVHVSLDAYCCVSL